MSCLIKLLLIVFTLHLIQCEDTITVNIKQKVEVKVEKELEAPKEDKGLQQEKEKGENEGKCEKEVKEVQRQKEVYGEKEIQGVQRVQGVQGIQGVQGEQGKQGVQEVQCEKGVQGKVENDEQNQVQQLMSQQNEQVQSQQQPVKSGSSLFTEEEVSKIISDDIGNTNKKYSQEYYDYIKMIHSDCYKTSDGQGNLVTCCKQQDKQMQDEEAGCYRRRYSCDYY